MKTYRLAIFDMDGTILDTLEDLADSMNHALALFGLPERSLSEIRSFVGNGLRNLAVRSVPAGTSEETTEAVYQELMSWYPAHSALKTCPYEGICEVLRQLKAAGIRTAVVSNKAEAAAQALAEFYFPGLFDAVLGDRPDRRRKPAPDAVEAVLARFGLARPEAVYIGDSEVDVATAQNAGVDLLAVSWGFRDKKLLKQYGAEIILHRPEELLTALGCH